MTTLTTNGNHKLWIRKVLIHLFCWSVFIVHELAYVIYLDGNKDPAYVYGVHYILNIGLFYATVYALRYAACPDARSRVKCLLIFGLSLICFLSFKSIANLLQIRSGNISAFLKSAMTELPYHLFRGSTFVVLAIFYHIFKRAVHYRQKLADSEIAFLRQQVNPHFLFNTLNFVYSKVLSSPDAACCIALLSDLMRYNMRTSDGLEHVMVQEEQEQIQALIDLNRLRFDKPMYLSYDPGDIRNKKIIPLVLLTIVENIFKHGDLSKGDHPGIIRMSADAEGKFYCFISNPKRQDGVLPSPKHGLANVKKRLELAYGKNFSLNINDTGNLYELELIIP